MKNFIYLRLLVFWTHCAQTFLLWCNPDENLVYYVQTRNQRTVISGNEGLRLNMCDVWYSGQSVAAGVSCYQD